jgi:hypothetical protein
MNPLLLPGFVPVIPQDLSDPALADPALDYHKLILFLRHPKDVAFRIHEKTLSHHDLLPNCLNIRYKRIPREGSVGVGQHPVCITEFRMGDCYQYRAGVQFLRMVSDDPDAIQKLMDVMDGDNIHPYFRLIREYRTFLISLERKEIHPETLSLLKGILD